MEYITKPDIIFLVTLISCLFFLKYNNNRLQNLLISKIKRWKNDYEKSYIFSVTLIIIILFQIVLIYTYDSNSTTVQGATIEVFGLIFDVILFGLIIGIYDKVVHKRNLIQNYLEEIDDYRGWKEKEASYRIFGNIKRLLKHDINDIDLTSCYFEDIEFSKHGLDSFDFKFFLFDKTIFKKCNLRLSKYNNIRHNQVTDYYAYFTTSFDKAIFENCNMRYSFFTNNNYDGLKFIENDLTGSNFNNSNFYNCTFDSSDLQKSTFENTKFHKCKFYNYTIENLSALKEQMTDCETFSFPSSFEKRP